MLLKKYVSNSKKGGMFMKKKYDKEILYKLMTRMSFRDRILMNLLKGYTYRILKKGIDIGFNWEE